MRLVFVHGRSQAAKDPAALKNEWVAALEQGLASQGLHLPAGVDVVFPYYGDLLERYSGRLGVPLTDELHVRGGAVDSDFQQYRGELLEEVRTQAGITDEQVSGEFGGEPVERGPLNQRWFHAILRCVDKYVPGGSSIAVDLFTRDVYVYLKVPGVQLEIDRIVSEELIEGPSVVVGHSLGSVVTYKLLRSDPRALKVPLYVTVGSPLGVRLIRNSFRPLKSPAPVARWYNAYDTRDIVALYGLDERNFPVTPAIENNNRVLNDTENRHGISGYLKDAAVSKKIYDALSLT
jgi:hypothetical protein